MATSKKKISNSRNNKKLWIITISVGVILVIAALWYFARNTTLSIYDKEEVRQGVKSALADANFPGSPVYTALDDIGCDSSNSVGTATRIYCGFEAQKYFKGTNLSAQLTEADSMLTTSGWQRGQDVTELADVVAGKNRGLRYSKDGLHILLAYYVSPALNNAPIKKLLDEKKIEPLEDGEFIYGVSTDASYWSCRNESIFIQLCPTPPSKPHL